MHTNLSVTRNSIELDVNRFQSGLHTISVARSNSMPLENPDLSAPRARRRRARGGDAEGGRDGESESSTTSSTFSSKFVAFGGATQPPRSSARARPSVSLRQTPHAKPFPALTAASAAPSGANSARFRASYVG